MGRKAALEVVAVGDGLPVEGAFHHPRIEDEVARQHAQREDEDRRIGRQHARRRILEMIQIHRSRDEAVEERHQHAGHDRQRDALAELRTLRTAALHPLRGDAVADDRRNDQRHAQKQDDGIAFGRTHVVDDDAQHQCQSDTQRKGDRQPRHGHRRREQDVRGIEDHAAQHDAPHAARIGLRQIGQERTPLGADAAHGEPHDERKEHHADDVVPIEKFVAPALRSQLLGVAPRSPAHHRDEAEKHCEGVTVDDKHRL